MTNNSTACSGEIYIQLCSLTHRESMLELISVVFCSFRSAPGPTCLRPHRGPDLRRRGGHTAGGRMSQKVRDAEMISQGIYRTVCPQCRLICLS